MKKMTNFTDFSALALLSLLLLMSMKRTILLAYSQPSESVVPGFLSMRQLDAQDYFIVNINRKYN